MGKSRKQGEQLSMDGMTTEAVAPVNTSVDPSQYVSMDSPSNKPANKEDEYVDFLNEQFPGNEKPLLENQEEDAAKTVDNNNKASALTPYILANTNPTEAINDKIDQTALQRLIDGNPMTQQEVQGLNDNSVHASDIITAAGSGLEKLSQLVNSAVQNPDVINQVTKDDILKAENDVEDAFISGDPAAYNKQQILNKFMETPNIKYGEPAIERLGLHEYYPDLQAPIRVGGYSGSIVGSNDIYTTQGGIFPASITDARARSLQDAAKEKAKVKEKVFEMASVKAAYPYQEQFDNATMGLLQKYGEKVGWDYSKLNPTSSKVGMEFYEEITKNRTLARVSRELESKGNELLKKYSGDEKAYVSPEQEQMLQKFFKGDWNVEKMMNDPEHRKEYMDLANKWNAYDNMTFHSQNAADQLIKSFDKQPLNIRKGINMDDPKFAKAYADLSTVEQHRDYDRYVRAMLEFVDDPRVTEASKGLLDQHHFSIGGSEEQKLDKVQKQILSYIGKKVDIVDKIASNNSLGWARLAHQKTVDQQYQPYTTLYNNTANPETKGMLQQIYGNPRLSADQQHKLASEMLEKSFGGKLTQTEQGKHNFEFVLPFKSEKGKVYKYQANQLYNTTDKEALLKNPAISEDVKSALKNPQGVFNAEVVSRKAQYYVPLNNGKVKPVTEDDIRKDPTLVNKMKPYAKNEYSVFIDVPVPNFPGKTERVYIPKTANVIDDLENINSRTEYDADVRENIGVMNRDIKQGQNTFMTEEFSTNAVEPDL